MKKTALLFSLLFFCVALIALPVMAQYFAPLDKMQRLEICTPTGLTSDANDLTPAQRFELARLCLTYFYGAYLCAPVKSVIEVIGTYGGKYNMEEKHIDPVAFAKQGAWVAHAKANAAQAELIGVAGVQARLNEWNRTASALFTYTHNKNQRLTPEALLGFIRGAEFKAICPHVEP